MGETNNYIPLYFQSIAKLNVNVVFIFVHHFSGSISVTFLLSQN